MRDKIPLRTELQRQQRITSRASSSSTPLPTSCPSPRSPLLFPHLEGSVSSSLPGAASVSPASPLLPPWSSRFSASARGLPPARPHLHRHSGMPELVLTSEGSPILLRQQRVVVLLRIPQVLVCNFSMGLLTCFLCRWHFPMGIPNVLILDQHRHAILVLELTLRQLGLVNSCLHTLCDLVMIASCPVRPLSFGQLQRTNSWRIILSCHLRCHVHIAIEDHDSVRPVSVLHQRRQPCVEDKRHKPWLISFAATQFDVGWDLQ